MKKRKRTVAEQIVFLETQQAELLSYKKEIKRAFKSPLLGADDKIKSFFAKGVPIKEAIDRLRRGSDSTPN